MMTNVRRALELDIAHYLDEATERLAFIEQLCDDEAPYADIRYEVEKVEEMLA